MKILSKGITLSYSTTSGSSATYTDVPDLVSIPAMGNNPEKVDVTTLANSQRQYINGLEDFGDNFVFGFVYDDNNDNFETLKALDDTLTYFKVTFPNSGPVFSFQGVPRTYISAVEVGSRVDFEMAVALQSDITMA